MESSYEDEGDDEEKDFSRAFLELVEEVGYFRQGDKKKYTIRDAIWLVDMVSECGVSTEKLPTLIIDVLRLFMGPHITEEVVQRLVPSSRTLNLILLAYYDWDKKRLKDKLEVDARPGSIHLQMDASHKAKSEYELSLAYYFSIRSSVVSQSVVQCKAAFSKKTGLGADAIFESMIDAYGPDVVASLNSVGGDNFAGGAQCTNFGRRVDQLVFELVTMNGPDRFIYQSRSIPSLKFNLTGPYRHLNFFFCISHSYERIFDPFFRKFLGNSGINNTASAAQFEYMYHWNFDEKYNPKWLAILCALLKTDDLKVVQDKLYALWKRLGKASTGRWLASGKACKKICEELEIPATSEMLEIARARLGLSMDEFKKICEPMRTIYSDPTITREVSVLCLATYILHSELPGGKSTPARTSLEALLHFMLSPQQRLSIVVVQEMLSFHQKLLAFAQGLPELDDGYSTVISVRHLESHAYLRKNLMEFVLGAAENWRVVFPDLGRKVAAISKHSKVQTPAEFIIFNSLKITEAYKLTVPPLLLYCRDLQLSIHRIFGLLVCPSVGPPVARALLKKMHQLKYQTITQTQLVFTDPKYVSECDSQASSVPWTTQNAIGYPYPQISRANLEYKVLHEILAPDKDVLTFLNKFGFSCPVLLAELVAIANYGVLMRMKSKRIDHTSYLSTYWSDILLVTYPALCQSLEFAYGCVASSSSQVESSFSITSHVVKPQNSIKKNEGTVLHKAGASSEHKREIIHFDKQSLGEGEVSALPLKLNRSTATRLELGHKLEMKVAKERSNGITLLDWSEPQLPAQFREHLKYIDADSLANSARLRSKGGFLKVSEIEAGSRAQDNALINGDQELAALPPLEGEDLLRKHISGLTVDSLHTFILKYNPAETTALLKKLNKKEKEHDQGRSLEALALALVVADQAAAADLKAFMDAEKIAKKVAKKEKKKRGDIGSSPLGDNVAPVAKRKKSDKDLTAKKTLTDRPKVAKVATRASRPVTASHSQDMTRNDAEEMRESDEDENALLYPS